MDVATTPRPSTNGVDGSSHTGLCWRSSSDLSRCLALLTPIPSLPSVFDLQDMGFSSTEAREALQFTNGDVEAAASYLAA